MTTGLDRNSYTTWCSEWVYRYSPTHYRPHSGRKRVHTMNKKEFIAIDTTKATKNDLLTALKGLPKAVTNENLLERVKYTVAKAEKSIKSVTVPDLKDLVVEAQTLLATPAPAPVEGMKKSAKKPSKKVIEPVEDDTDDEEPAEEEKPAKKGKKSLKMKTAKPKTHASKELPVAEMFPEELSFEADDGEKTLVCVHDKYHTLQEVRDALEEGKTLFIAAYWTKRHIQQYNYKEQFSVPKAPKNFPDDLDILNIVVACDSFDRVFAMSTYTEALYRFDGETFTPVEDKNDDGDEFTVRVSNGMEFEVYEIAE